MADFTAKHMVVMELEQRMPAVEKTSSEGGRKRHLRTKNLRHGAHRPPQGVAGCENLRTGSRLWITGRDDDHVQGHQELLHVRSLQNHAVLHGRYFRHEELEH
eukprot:581508-Heterocapsa_arctica.AAC.1